MRILLACPYAWDAPGGVQTHVRELATTLVSRGHAVTVVAPARRPRAHDGRRDPALHLVGGVVALSWNGAIATLCPSPRSLRRIRRVLATFRPEIVHVHEPFVPSTSMLTALAADAPVVATFHAFSERARVMTATAPILRIVGRRIATAIAVSATAAEHAARVFTGPIAIVPNGVSADHFRRPPAPADGMPRGRVILWVHRLEPRKGFTVALRAFAALAAELADLHMLVIGDGSERAALARIPAEYRGRVTLLGQVDNDDLPPHHAAADVFVAPSLGPETFGIALVEAMAAGVPVVASDIRGYRHVVRDGVDGLLVPPRDPTALAAALRRVLTEPELAAALARAGRTRAEQYAWDAVVPALEAIYEQLAPAARPQRAVSARRRNASHAATTSTTSKSASVP